MCLILQKGITEQYATSLQACPLCATVDDYSMGSVLDSVTFTRQGNSSHQCASAPSSHAATGLYLENLCHILLSLLLTCNAASLA